MRKRQIATLAALLSFPLAFAQAPPAATASAPAPAAPTAPAASPAELEAIHNELRAVRDGVVAAVAKSDVDGLLKFLHPNVVVTWQNAVASRGHDGVRKYLDQMLKGSGKIVKSFSMKPNVDELTILYSGNNTGIAFGSSHETFDLTSGLAFELDSRWSATLVRENGSWLIASFHASTNLFDNALLRAAQKMTYLVGGVALIVGLGVGFLLGRRRG